jgi:SpoVK/Ycf46/Vps4 family AAA+-type ATPase
VLRSSLCELPVTDAWVNARARQSHLSPGLIAKASRVIRAVGDGGAERNEAVLDRVIDNSLEAMSVTTKHTRAEAPRDTAYSTDLLNVNTDVEALIQGIRTTRRGRLCLYGPPGTGKSELGKYLANQMASPLLIRRASDLLDPYVGRTEQNIAAMFNEARDTDSVILLDEADSFLRDRRAQQHGWEVTQVNELLTQMESFNGVFVCSTNLMNTIDGASLRRFDFKIEFGYLRPDQAWLMFRRSLADGDSTAADIASYEGRIRELRLLTPGDFSVVLRRLRILSSRLDPAALYRGLVIEHDLKEDVHPRQIGFHADL